VSQESVDILLGGYEWFRVNGRFPAHLATPDFVWDMSHFDYGLQEQQVYEGAQGADDFFAEWCLAWDDWEVEIAALHDLGDKVLVIVKQRGRSKLSGIPAETLMAMPWTFRDGKCTRMEMYADQHEALKPWGSYEGAAVKKQR
jgi:ketosteroid isomerase-like protein